MSLRKNTFPPRITFPEKNQFQKYRWNDVSFSIYTEAEIIHCWISYTAPYDTRDFSDRRKMTLDEYLGLYAKTLLKESKIVTYKIFF